MDFIKTLDNFFNNTRVLLYFLLILTFIILGIKCLFGQRKTVQITTSDIGKKIKVCFMEKCKEKVKKCKILSCDKKKIVFEDKKATYECSPNEVKRVKKSKSFIALIVTMITFGVLALTDYIVSYMTEPVYLSQTVYGFQDDEEDWP